MVNPPNGEILEIDYDRDFMVCLVTFCSIMLTIIIVANITVIVRIMSLKRFSRMNFFLLNLSIADVLVGAVVVLPDVMEKSKVSYVPYKCICKIHYLLSIAVSCNASFALACVSFDRLLAIAYPFFIQSKNIRWLLLGSSWLISLSNGTPMITFRQIMRIRLTSTYLNYTTSEDINICAINVTRQQSRILVLYYATMIFFLPCTIISICYTIIMRILWSKSRKTNCYFTHLEKVDNCCTFQESKMQAVSSHDYRTNNTIQLLLRARLKSVKISFIIVSAFVACWSPYFIFNLLSTLGIIKSGRSVIFMQSMGYLSSAINPIIYWTFTKKTK
ncbi:hypothetical protein GJ496_008808 [Pomphorhynchus laevis]|nr:hypothetical protein GJ496_008808 [Pomphorhynchus laevis]